MIKILKEKSNYNDFINNIQMAPRKSYRLNYKKNVSRKQSHCRNRYSLECGSKCKIRRRSPRRSGHS